MLIVFHRVWVFFAVFSVERVGETDRIVGSTTALATVVASRGAV